MVAGHHHTAVCGTDCYWRGLVARSGDVTHPDRRRSVRPPASPGAAASLGPPLHRTAHRRRGVPDHRRAGQESATKIQIALILIGIVAVLAGVMLIGPIAIRGIAKCAARVPIAGRLALRDLSRYQARSGAALAAIAIAIGIPVAIVATTAAAENNVGLGNLSTSQLLIRPADIEGGAAAQPSIDAIAGAVQDATVTPLNFVLAADSPAVIGPRGAPPISLAREVERGWTDMTPLYVASPDLLALYGLTTSDMASSSGIITNEDRDDLEVVDFHRSRTDPRDEHEQLVASQSLPDSYSSLPHTFIDPDRLADYGWQSVPSGQWLIQTATPLTASELDAVRVIAAQHGLTVESREDQQTLANVRLGAVAVGMLLALGILAMTVGLIRAESAGDLRTLTATGATSSTRRNITATTAGDSPASAPSSGSAAPISPWPRAESATSRPYRSWTSRSSSSGRRSRRVSSVGSWQDASQRCWPDARSADIVRVLAAHPGCSETLRRTGNTPPGRKHSSADARSGRGPSGRRFPSRTASWRSRCVGSGWCLRRSG